MDEDRPSYGLQAPGASPAAETMRLPGREDCPRLDDHLVEPEVSREEIIGGRRIETMGSNPPHAFRHSELDYVLRAKAQSGYRTASDLLTRVDEESDFATDASIVKDGVDAAGVRHLEELAFEVVSTQSKSDVTDKAVRMHRRGVRRIFAIFLEQRRVSEWSAANRSWKALQAESVIDDPCLVEPLEVKALLDAAAADNAVASALITKGNPVIEKLRAGDRAEARAEGKTEGKAEAVLSILKARGLEPSDTVRERVLSCTELDLLERWLQRAATASAADEVLENR